MRRKRAEGGGGLPCCLMCLAANLPHSRHLALPSSNALFRVASFKSSKERGHATTFSLSAIIKIK